MNTLSLSRVACAQAARSLGRILPVAATLLLSFTRTAFAETVKLAGEPVGEPWTDADPADPPARWQPSEDSLFGFKAGAEYRTNAMVVDPVAINSVSERRLELIQHRLRLDGTVDFRKQISFTTSWDIMDGVLWGDNGTRGSSDFRPEAASLYRANAPEPDTGFHSVYHNPNAAVPCIVQKGPSAIDRNSYGYGLCNGTPVYVRRMYGTIPLPFGFAVVGRMAGTLGHGLGLNDGEGRSNRFGYSNRGDTIDGAMIGSKPFEIALPAYEKNFSPDYGFVTILSYGRTSSGSPARFNDNVDQLALILRWGMPDLAPRKALDLLFVAASRSDPQYDTKSIVLVGKVAARISDVKGSLEVVHVRAKSTEGAVSYRPLTGDNPYSEPVALTGARAVLRYDQESWTAYAEVDYATGDKDPRPDTPYNGMVWAPDSNVGLLLFKQIIGFESARSAAAGNAILNHASNSYASDAANTRGAFNNALAVFPQFDYRPDETTMVRLGVLAAWADEPAVDIPTSIKRYVGGIKDYAVNYWGGKPAKFYGTEIDGRFQWRWQEHFIFDLEGAVFFPGDAVKNEQGLASRSVLVQGRTTFFF